MKKVLFLKWCYLVGMCLSFLMFAASIAIAIYFKDVAFLIDGIPFVVYGALLLDLLLKQSTMAKIKEASKGIVLITLKQMCDLQRYEKLYGKLPEANPENKEEQTEEKKEE